MLQNSVHPIMELQSKTKPTSTSADQKGAQSAASAYDAMFAVKEAPSLCPKGCAVYLHDMVEPEFYDAQDEVLINDIDAPLGTLQAQVHQQKIPPKPPRVSQL